MPRKVFWSGKLEVRQLERLKALSERTRVPVAEMVRQGVDLVLQREELKLAALAAGVPAVLLDRMLEGAGARPVPARRRARKGRAA